MLHVRVCAVLNPGHSPLPRAPAFSSVFPFCPRSPSASDLALSCLVGLFSGTEAVFEDIGTSQGQGV